MKTTHSLTDLCEYKIQAGRAHSNSEKTSVANHILQFLLHSAPRKKGKLLN